MPDILAVGLRIVFVGYNPGPKSAAVGHHFAGPGNYFWRLLYDAGLTDRLLTWEEDERLPAWGLGVTNLVDRMTPSSGDLTRRELEAGAARTRARLSVLAPTWVCLLGKDVYRWYAGRAASARVAWGVAQPPTAPGPGLFVAPNPSRRSTIPYAERLRVWSALADASGARRP